MKENVRKFGGLWLAVGFLFLFSVLLMSTARSTSLVYDEIIYAPAGLLYWKTHDFRWNPEHPPLQKFISSLPLLFLNVPIPSGMDPTKLDAWRAGNRVLFQTDLKTPALIFWMRIPSLVAALLTALLAFFWTRRVYGLRAALVTLMLLTWDPLFISNGALALDDIFVTAFGLCAIFSCLRFAETSEIRWALATGLMVGAATTSKLSGLILIPCLFLLGWLSPNPARKISVDFLKVVGLAIGAFVLVWLSVYRFDIAAIWRCLHAEQGMEISMSTPRFLLGPLPRRFHWIYYPVAMLIKTPLPILFLWIFSMGLFARKRHMLRDRARVSMLVLPVILFAALFFSTSRAAWRYFLPAIPLLAVFVGSTTVWLRNRVERCLCVVLLAWLAVETISTHPFHMAYFNQLIGGSKNGYRWLDGSNQDWGQDIPSLVKLINQQPVRPTICLGYWGSDRPEIWGLEYQDVFSAAITNKFRQETVNDPTTPREWLVVSAYMRTNPGLCSAYNWLYDRQPIAVVGNTLFVYDITTDEESIQQIGNIYQMMGRSALAQRQADRLEYLASLRP